MRVAALRHHRRLASASISDSCRGQEVDARAARPRVGGPQMRVAVRPRSHARSRAARRKARTVRQARARSRRRRWDRYSPISLPASSIGSQPRALHRLQQRADPALALVGHGRAGQRRRMGFSRARSRRGTAPGAFRPDAIHSTKSRFDSTGCESTTSRAMHCFPENGRQRPQAAPR